MAKTIRTLGEVKSLPTRNAWGQKQYRVAVDEVFAKEINAAWEAAFNATPKMCLNKTAPAWFDEDRKTWTVTVGTGVAGMYPQGVSHNKPCKVSFRIDAGKYTQIVASAMDEIAEANALVAVEKMEVLREALEAREFDEKLTGINAKLKSMAVLAGELGIPLGDLMSADKIISAEKERIAEAKKATAKKGSTLRTTTSVVTKTKVEDKSETDIPTVKLTSKTIAKWENLSEEDLQTAMEAYAEMTDVELADVQAAWELATADSDVPF
jgi:hypothetical protein